MTMGMTPLHSSATVIRFGSGGEYMPPLESVPQMDLNSEVTHFAPDGASGQRSESLRNGADAGPALGVSSDSRSLWFEVVWQPSSADEPIVLRSVTDSNEATVAFHEELAGLMTQRRSGELLVRKHPAPRTPILRLPLDRGESRLDHR